jgi:hypothetical protein
LSITINQSINCSLINLVSSQMETLQKILRSNGSYGPPPKQPSLTDRLRAAFRRLCKYNFDQKDYANQNKPKQNETKQGKSRKSSKAK